MKEKTVTILPFLLIGSSGSKQLFLLKAFHKVLVFSVTEAETINHTKCDFLTFLYFPA
jgi:hypothetical protein